MEFTLKQAKEYAKGNNIDKWVDKLLRATNNENFANFTKDKGYWLGPIKISLSKLKRCCGPEKEMKFNEPSDTWNKRTNKMIKDIEKGWDIPPIIVWFLNKELSVADGSHRLEALRKSGFKKFWTIIWFDNLEDYKKNNSNL
mgnify:CR=1 FL=1|jgi:hypothetical protein